MEGEAPPPVHLGVPHPDATHLGVAEVVRIEHPGDPCLEVDGHESLVLVSGGGEVGRVDDGQFGLELGPGGEVEMLLHSGEVGVALFHDQPGRHRPIWVVADVPVEDHDLGIGQMSVLGGGDIGIRLAGDGGTEMVLGTVGDDHGLVGRAGGHRGEDVEAAEFGQMGVGLLLGKRAQVLDAQALLDRAGTNRHR